MMFNPFEAIIAMQMRFWYQWLEATQTMFHTIGVWGAKPADATVFTPAVVKAITPRANGCVGPADLGR